MDLRKLKTLIDLVSESGISELEVTEGEGKVRIVKNAPPVYVQQPGNFAPQFAAPAPAAVGHAAEAPAGAPATPAAAAPQGHVVTSPMVGTFYRAPSPGADPFVQVGSKVTADTVVAIVETMKLMTPVTAGAAGTISELCVENATPIVAGDVLMKLA